MPSNAARIGSILRELNLLDQPLTQHVNQVARHAKTLASLKIVDARLLLQAITEFQKENLAHKLAVKHLLGEVESLSRGSKDTALRQQLANIRGLSTNLNNKLDVLHSDLEKVRANALRQMNDPGRADDPDGGSPLTNIISMIVQITTLLIKRRKPRPSE